MAKTYSNLFEEIVSFPNLLAAYFEARRGKMNCASIMKLNRNYEDVIFTLQKELREKTWEPKQYREFLCVTEVKRRIINAPAFEDRIVHHAMAKVIRPLFERKYIYDSYATIKNKGTHKAVYRVQDFLKRAARRGESVYILQCDISKYYQSIDHDVLIEQIERTIRDKEVVELWKKIIDGFSDTGKGVPIGSLTSQLAANIYLNVLDHFIKECMQIKYYVRYMDDFVLIGNSKEELWKNLADIKWLVEGHLKLKLNRKTKIYPASRGVDFAGYRTFTSYILPRKRNIKAAKKRFKDISHKYKNGEMDLESVRQRVTSFLGYVKHCQAKRTTISTLKWLKLRRKIKW